MKLQRNGFDFIFLDRIYRIDGIFFSPSARSPFGRRPFYPDVPVKLRMKKNRGKWKVYDLTALGISAVSNYRAQLHQILQKKSPEEVIDIFKEKIGETEEDA